MKCAIVLCVVLSVAFAAPEAPYPPSGWKPSGQQFSLPNKDYGGPPQEYGPADGTTEEPTTTEEPASETSTSSRFSRLPARFTASKINQRASEYYVVSPISSTAQQFGANLNQGQRSEQLNQQGSSEYYIITPEGGVQQITVPNQQVNQESEQVTTVRNNSPLGKLVSLPVSNSQFTSQAAAQKSRIQAEQQRARIQVVQVQQSAPESQATSQYFALTSDGRLQPVPARTVASENQQETSQRLTNPQNTVVLTPGGKFERLLLQPVPAAQRTENGQYNLLTASGKLQRVQFMNILTPDNRLSSNVEYNDVQPVSGPLYTYGSPLVRVV